MGELDPLVGLVVVGHVAGGIAAVSVDGADHNASAGVIAGIHGEEGGSRLTHRDQVAAAELDVGGVQGGLIRSHVDLAAGHDDITATVRAGGDGPVAAGDGQLAAADDHVRFALLRADGADGIAVIDDVGHRDRQAAALQTEVALNIAELHIGIHRTGLDGQIVTGKGIGIILVLDRAAVADGQAAAALARLDDPGNIHVAGGGTHQRTIPIARRLDHVGTLQHDGDGALARQQAGKALGIVGTLQIEIAQGQRAAILAGFIFPSLGIQHVRHLGIGAQIQVLRAGGCRLVC